MKLKIAVVVGSRNIGKSWVLKSLTQEISLREIDNLKIRPTVWAESDDLSQFGFVVKKPKNCREKDWGIDWRLKDGDVKISDWDVLKNSSKDIFASGSINGQRVLISSEGDYPWSWILNLKYLDEAVGADGGNDEILMFCACQVNRQDDNAHLKERGYELCRATTIEYIKDASFDICFFSLSKRSEQASVLSSLKKLLRL